LHQHDTGYRRPRCPWSCGHRVAALCGIEAHTLLIPTSSVCLPRTRSRPASELSMSRRRLDPRGRRSSLKVRHFQWFLGQSVGVPRRVGGFLMGCRLAVPAVPVAERSTRWSATAKCDAAPPRAPLPPPFPPPAAARPGPATQSAAAGPTPMFARGPVLCPSRRRRGPCGSPGCRAPTPGRLVVQRASAVSLRGWLPSPLPSPPPPLPRGSAKRLRHLCREALPPLARRALVRVAGEAAAPSLTTGAPDPQPALAAAAAVGRAGPGALAAPRARPHGCQYPPDSPPMV